MPMKTYPGLAVRLIGACVTLAMLAGCGGSQTNAVVPNSASQRLGSDLSQNAASRTQDLLYVSHHDDGSVDIYSYPDGKYWGQLKDVRASGLCSDNNGDVFIPAGDSIREYAHGETRPIAVLHGSLGGIVQACAVDATTGNLAVSGGTYPRFGVAVYSDAQGSPKIYNLPNRKGAYLSSTYDDKGNLFVESSTPKAVDVVELPKDAERVRSVALTGTQPVGIGSIQWDGKYIAILASNAAGSATVLRYSVLGNRAAFAGAIALKDAGGSAQSWIQGGKIVVPGSVGANIYGYPAGGVAAATIKDQRGLQAVTVSPGLKAGVDVVTYHNDNLRTGWDSSETSLTYKSVSAGSFGLIQSVPLDDQVDAQPLIVRNEKISTGKTSGRRDVVYVATENNTVYAIDASSGAVLFSTNLGSPVQTPLGCNNNGPNVGIDSTPVIDLSANAMYVIAYTLVGSVPTYMIHELDLSNLSDVVPPSIITATHKLTDGTIYTFNATYERQRPALLEANGNVYAGFGSFCDFGGDISRGWLLGWQTGSLAPLPANRLTDALAKPYFFLSSIWMSGYGLAADPTGNIYFVTGNSQPKTYTGDSNIQESVVKVSGDLTHLLSVFTPSDVNSLDDEDTDFGAGGALLLPTLTSADTPLVAAAGKEGTMFLMNQNSLGGHSKNQNNVLAQANIGGCWCGLSYFDSSDALPTIVASGGNSVTLWRVHNSPVVKLHEGGSSSGLPGGQDPGFFTAVSSNGTHPGAIIWALARPNEVPGSMELVALQSQPKGGVMQTLYQTTGGFWNATGGNANLVPTVANGKVYVASYEQLNIFGLGGTKGIPKRPPGLAAHEAQMHAHQVTGQLLGIDKAILTLKSRSGSILKVDDGVAVRSYRTEDLVMGKFFTIRGNYDKTGTLHALAILRAKPSQSTWPPDRR
jgi:hypothetical protein